MHNDALKGDPKHYFETTVIILTPTEHCLLQVPIFVDVGHIDVGAIIDCGESFCEITSSMVDMGQPAIPVDFHDQHDGHLINDRDDVTVKLVLMDRPCQICLHDGTVDDIPPRIVVDVDEAYLRTTGQPGSPHGGSAVGAAR